jgi:hypothetical protein
MTQLKSLFTSPKVAVRVLTRDVPSAWCQEGLRRIHALRPEWDIQAQRNRYAIDVNRNMVIAEMRKTPFDFLLMLDDDVQPMDAVVNLPSHNVPVVCGLVPTWRDGFIFWNAFHLNEDATLMHSVRTCGPHTGLERVFAAGTAIMCIRRDIFMNTDMDPLFAFDKKADGTLTGVLGGEDVYFCRKMNAKGHPILIDHGVQGEHVPRIKLLETIIRGRQHADRDPDYCFPSVFAFDLRKLSGDLGADAYLAYRREQADAEPPENGKAIPDPAGVPGPESGVRPEREPGVEALPT